MFELFYILEFNEKVIFCEVNLTVYSHDSRSISYREEFYIHTSRKTFML